MGSKISIDISKTERAFGIQCQSLIAPQPDFIPPFHPTFCLVSEGEATTAHSHFESEMFLILKGEGHLQLDQEIFPVKTGDTIFIQPFTRHQLFADSLSAVEFLSVYSARVAGQPLPRRTLVAAAPPTPNGALHLGHLSGPYLATDVLTRYLRQRSLSCVSLSGTDDHQPYVAIQATREEKTVPELVEKYRAQIQQGLEEAGISYDRFLNPIHDTQYRHYVSNLFATLRKEEVFVFKKVMAAFNEEGQALTDPEISGNCPHCDAFVVGNGCEECGAVFPISSMKSPKIHTNKGKVTFIEIDRLVLPLEKYRSFLERYHAGERPPTVRRFLNAALSRPLPDMEVTFPHSMGIAVPDSRESLSINPWIEMAAGYLMQCQPDTTFLPAFGFDNVFYYTLVLPAIFGAAGRSDALPRQFITNEFYHLEGSKFSTSRRHALWAVETLNSVDVNLIRFHLAFHRPESAQTEFRFAEIRRLTENFFKPLNQFILSLDFTSLPEEAPSVMSSDARKLWIQLAVFIEQLESAYHPETFSLRRAARVLVEFIETIPAALAGLAFAEQQTMKLVAARTFAKGAYPLLPELSLKLLQALGFDLFWDTEPKYEKPATVFTANHFGANNFSGPLDIASNLLAIEQLETEFQK